MVAQRLKKIYIVIELSMSIMKGIDRMSERDRIAEIEDLTVKEFKAEINNTIENLRRGVKTGNAIELLAAALKISHLGEDLKVALEKWLQFDLWEKVKEK
jgi:hypothetical protein